MTSYDYYCASYITSCLSPIFENLNLAFYVFHESYFDKKALMVAELMCDHDEKLHNLQSLASK